MTKAFTIIYKVNGETRETKWYARTAENAKALFEMWHTGVEIIEVK